MGLLDLIHNYKSIVTQFHSNLNSFVSTEIQSERFLMKIYYSILYFTIVYTIVNFTLLHKTLFHKKVFVTGDFNLQ